MHDIAFCAIIKDEARYLDEWLAYHCLIGVEHFYITDDNSTDNIQEVLQKWIKKGLVTYMKVDEFLRTSSVRQIISDLTYCDILKNSYKYLGFLDIDEFLVPPNGNIRDFLRTIPCEVASIYIRWVFFGLSETSSGLLTERCLNHSNYFSGHGKSIVNPRNIAINVKTNPHIFHPVQGEKILDFDFSLAEWSEDLSFFKDIPITEKNANLPRINHYYGKSKAEIEAKQKRGRFNANKNVYSVHNFFEKKGFPETFFSLADFSDSINNFIGELENEFPGGITWSGLSYLHGEDLIFSAKTLASPPAEAPQYIVSLTSYGTRLQSTAPIAIASVLHGNILPGRIVLWVAEKDRQATEKNVQLQVLQEKGLEIRYCEDLKSYKKLIPALQEFPNDFIITADDDLLYPKNWLEQMMEYHRMHPDKIICHRVHGIRVDTEHNLLPYKNWDWCVEPQEQERIFPTGGAGTLYPPHCLHKDVFNRDLFMKLAPQADDVWFWAMALINGDSPHIVIKNGYSNSIIDIGVQNNALQNSNVAGGRNDMQLKAVIENYPQIMEVMKKIRPFTLEYIETAQNANFDFKLPEMKYPDLGEGGVSVSVTVPIYNGKRYLRESLDSILAQTFKNWEAILVNDGSTDGSKEIIDEYARLDSRFKAVHKQNGGTLLARKTGLENSKGKYIANLDCDDIYEPDFLEKMLAKITETDADFVWCKANVFENSNVGEAPACASDDSYDCCKNKAEKILSIFLGEIRCFLTNKLIKRNIYERVKFPEKHIVWAEDPIQTMQIIYYSNNVVFVPETFYNYRVDSITSTSQTTTLMGEEKSRIHRIIGPIVMIKILQDFFGSSFPFHISLDAYFKKAIWFYNSLDRETRIKYGIEGIILDKNKPPC